MRMRRLTRQELSAHLRTMRQVGMQQQQSPPQETVIQQTGDTVTQPRYDLALGNWAQILAVAPTIITAQTGPPTNTAVLAVALMPQTSGIFFVSARLSWSNNTTAISVTHALVTKQGAAGGAITGGGTAGKFGQYSGGANQLTSTGSTFTANAQFLNVNAAGGNGLLFEGAALSAGSVVQHSDVAATLTGLLTANAIGSSPPFSFAGYIDAGGIATKTPFTVRQPACFAVLLTASGASTVTYDSASLFVQETVTL